ncbi:MAG: hypothetical protein LUE27_00870 [Clostridia bacterium]|nr:hypothetical protein [Clostridia bacterium]
MPEYVPETEIISTAEGDVLHVRCRASEDIPHRAPVRLSSHGGAELRYEVWVWYNSHIEIANESEMENLLMRSQSVSFDDNVCRNASIKDIHRCYVEDYLVETRSPLAEKMDGKSLEELLLAMGMADNGSGSMLLRNIAVLLFSERPDRFIPYTRTETVRFYDSLEEASDHFTEKFFYGPVWKQMRDCLDWLQAVLVEEHVVKSRNRVRADRYWSYPVDAIREALANAFMHQAYNSYSYVSPEVRVYKDRVEISSVPGIPADMDWNSFIHGKAGSRIARNRHLAEAFKSLGLSSNTGEGISMMLESLEKNGSRPPEFRSRNFRTGLTVTIYGRSYVGSAEQRN